MAALRAMVGPPGYRDTQDARTLGGLYEPFIDRQRQFQPPSLGQLRNLPPRNRGYINHRCALNGVNECEWQWIRACLNPSDPNVRVKQHYCNASQSDSGAAGAMMSPTLRVPASRCDGLRFGWALVEADAMTTASTSSTASTMTSTCRALCIPGGRSITIR